MPWLNNTGDRCREARREKLILTPVSLDASIGYKLNSRDFLLAVIGTALFKNFSDLVWDLVHSNDKTAVANSLSELATTAVYDLPQQLTLLAKSDDALYPVNQREAVAARLAFIAAILGRGAQIAMSDRSEDALDNLAKEAALSLFWLLDLLSSMGVDVDQAFENALDATTKRPHLKHKGRL